MTAISRMTKYVTGRLAAGMLMFAAVAAGAQTLATGDSRTVVEPTFPAACTVLTAQQAVVSGAPASETLTDTARIQAALTACPAGQAVELAGSAGNYAFLTAPINIPTGVSLIVDGGVTLFASRFAADYQTSSTELCGSYGASGNGCNVLIQFAKGSTNANSGIYGYGVIDARGGSTILKLTSGVVTDTGISWWTNADQANTAGLSQDNPIIMKPAKSTNLTLYKITFRNSPQFHIGTSGINGFTVWGVKIQAPFTAHNTDGIDPQGTNVTITNSSISDGDDNIAVGASSASSNITISNVTTYSGHGISVGSYTQGGLNNMLVKNSNMAGTAADGNATGLRLKSAADRGAVVQNITYQNICMRDMRYPLIVTGYYNTNSGTLIPTFTNIVYQNVHVLPPTATKYPYRFQLQGYDASHISTMTWNNFVVESLLSTNVVGTTTSTPAYTSVALAGDIYPAFLTTLTGTGVTETGASTSNSVTGAYDCSAISTVFPYIVGELYVSTPTATNLQTVTVGSGTAVTLNAMVQPAMAQTSFSGTVGSYTGAAALTAGVNFYEGTTLVGTGSLSANGSLASVTLTGVTQGPHTYTAKYAGDANYTALPFGSVTVVVGAASTPSTTKLTAPSTAVYSASTTLTATVTGTGATPTGTVAFYDGAASLGSMSLTSGSASVAVQLAGGSHTLSAVYSGDGTYITSTSSNSAFTVTTAASSTAVTANPATIFAGASTTLTATVTGVSGLATPGGTVTFSDGGTSLGNANVVAGVASLPVTLSTAIAHTITATYNADSNYAASSGTATVTVNSTATTATLTAPGSIVYGTLPTLSASVTNAAGTPTGTVTFYDGAVVLGTGTLSAGTASLQLTTVLTGGAHTLKAVYGGDGTFVTSTSANSTLTVTTAASATALKTSLTAVTVGGSVTLTATVSGVAGGLTPTGSVAFADGSTSLGSASLSGGTASVTVPLTTIGSRTLTASYGGDMNYAVSSGTAAETVNAIATTIALAPAAATTYTGASFTLTATVAAGTSPIPAGTVTFYSGTTALGTASVNTANGTATYTLTVGVAGTYSYTASFGANGNYAASPSSTASTLTVVTPFTFAVTPSSVSVAPGSSAAVSMAITPGGGFTGAAVLGCSSPANFVTCTVASSSTSLSGTATQTVAGTVAVALVKSSLEQPSSGTAYAWLLPAGLLGLAGALRRRKLLRGALLFGVLGFAGMFGLVGCGGGATTSTTTTSNKPTGSYTVTFTATANGVTQSSGVTVNITN